MLYFNCMSTLYKAGKIVKWIKCNDSDFSSGKTLNVVPTCFLTVCSCFSWRTDTDVCFSKLATRFSSSTWFLTKTTYKEWELKITKDLHFHVLNKLRLYGDRCNYRGVKDPNFTQTKYKTKQYWKIRENKLFSI